MSSVINYSIIIPHKNRQELLRKCLTTIPCRSDLEIIIVDDGSDIEHVDFENFPGLGHKNVEIIFVGRSMGGGYARNLGLKRAKGKWIIFADSDDYFTDKLNTILDENLDSKADVIYFRAESIDIITGKHSNRADGLNKFIDYAILKNDFNYLRYQLAYPISKIISSKVIFEKNITFEEIMNGNDVFFLFD